MKNMRIDEWMVHHGVADNLPLARALLMAGNVLVNDRPVTKAGYSVSEKDRIRLRGVRKFVSRGGEKLSAALEEWDFPVKGKIFLDIGASTGGFSDALLQKGAARIYALDVAYGILDDKIRSDPRVTPIERTHICRLSPEQMAERPDYFVADVSFISLKKVLLCLQKLFSEGFEGSGFEGIALFKPQFEAPPEALQGGILKDDELLERTIRDFKLFLDSHDIDVLHAMASPLLGAKGNREYLYHLSWTKTASGSPEKDR